MSQMTSFDINSSQYYPMVRFQTPEGVEDVEVRLMSIDRSDSGSDEDISPLATVVENIEYGKTLLRNLITVVSARNSFGQFFLNHRAILSKRSLLSAEKCSVTSVCPPLHGRQRPSLSVRHRKFRKSSLSMVWPSLRRMAPGLTRLSSVATAG